MPHRRDFLRMLAAGAAAGVTGPAFGAAPAAAQTTPARRRVSIAGRQVRVIDVHAHC